ncbi:MAG: decaprenyl-phosphate phosphoribosyltransferase [Actinomycetes bacterium]
MAQIGPLVRGMRLRQWLKNVLVFVAPAAAGSLLERGTLGHALLAFSAFCLTASGLYLVNDVRDVNGDRLHAKKRFRPIASGALPIPTALVAAGVLVAGGLAIGFITLSASFGLILCIYVAITMAYSIVLKTQPVIELACVASGFVLRAVGGGAATQTRLSVWFVVVISFGALFVVTGKRLAEMPGPDGSQGEHRAVLSEYTPSFLKSTLTLSATVSITAYCLWAFENTTISVRAHGSEVWIQLTVVPVVLGCLHVLRRLDRGDGAAPEELAYKDRTLQVLGVLWLGLILIGIYL